MGDFFIFSRPFFYPRIMATITGPLFYVEADYAEPKGDAIGAGFTCFTLEQAETIANTWRLDRPDLENIKIRRSGFKVGY